MIINILLLLVSLIALYLALVTYFHNSKNPINISFSVLTFSGSIWPFSIAMFRLAQNIEAALLWDRIVYLGGSIFPCAFLYFSYVFPFSVKKRLIKVKFLIFSSFLIITLALFKSNFFIKEIIINNFGNSVNLGWLYIFWVIWFVILIAYGFLNLIKRYKTADKLSRLQLIYIFLAIGIPASFSLPFNVILPLFGNYQYVWIGPFFILAMILIITYAISRYRLMDIKLILKHGFVYLMSLILTIAFGFLLISVHKIYFVFIPLLVAETIILILAISLFHPIKSFIEFLVDRYFYNSNYSYQQALKKLSQETTKIIVLEQLIDMIVDTVMKSMGLNRTGVLLADKIIENNDNQEDNEINYYKIAKVIGFDESNGISLVKDNFLTSYLQKTKKAIVFDEINLMVRDAHNEDEKNNLKNLRDNMRKIEAGVCLPLFSRKKLIGLLVLGHKISNEPYTEEDVHLLETLANQTSVAISNALLYQEVKQARLQLEDFNDDLQVKVDEAIKELKDKNEELEELLRMKSEFLTIASHQLRTPTSIVRGSLSMILEEERLDEKQKQEFLEQAYSSINHLERIIHDLLSATEMDGNKMKLLPEAVNLKKIIEQVIKERKSLAEKKGLTLKFISKKVVPQALADSSKIEEVVDNLVDNAIHYTDKGEVTVSLNHNKNYVWFKIADTGVGLTKEDREILFQRFERGGGAAKIHPNGSGLGLYIVKGIIDALDGKIEVDSDGKDKGTVFKVYLPIVKD